MRDENGNSYTENDIDRWAYEAENMQCMRDYEITFYAFRAWETRETQDDNRALIGNGEGT